MDKKSAIVIGAGIVGLAIARGLAQKGFSVKVFERSHRAVGASIRNFGLILPLAQPIGKRYDRAIRSRQIWKEICDQAHIWYDPSGSLLPAYFSDEWEVLQELAEVFGREKRPVSLLPREELASVSRAVVARNLKGALLSRDELMVDPRQAIGALTAYLEEKWNVAFHWGKCVSYIADQTAYIGNIDEHEADLIFICSGSDFETLYPESFSSLPITKCKLQMMRLRAPRQDWRLGPALFGGLSLLHYDSFKVAASLPVLRKRYEQEMADYLKWGIHVMVTQNESGDLTVGDSHEYSMTHDPFDRDFINRMILDYLHQFADCKDWTLVETWNGIYPKLTDGQTDLVFAPEPGVYLVNGVSGAGMTISFGLAEEIVAGL